MEKGIIETAEKWWKENVLQIKPEQKKAKVGKVKVRLKSKKEKGIIKTLNGPFGRMEHPHDDIQ